MVGIGPGALTLSLESAVLAAGTLDAVLLKIGLAPLVEPLLGPVANVVAGEGGKIGQDRKSVCRERVCLYV